MIKSDTNPPPKEEEEAPSPSYNESDFTFDPDDPNYVENGDLLVKIQEMYQRLPEGWSRGKEGGPPFVHESGKVSWKHPSRAEIMKLVTNFQGEQTAKESQRWGPSYNPKKAMIKRLRMMVKSGVPMHAVEQRARLEGIDPAVLMDDATVETSSPKSSSSRSPSPPHAWNKKPKDPFKKYRLMLKNGIPLQAVQQTAERDGVNVEEFLSACGVREHVADVADKNENKDDNDDDLDKYHAMLKSGVPLGAVQNQMKLEGFDPSKLKAGSTAPRFGLNKKDPLKKYRTMLKNRLPWAAVKQRMEIDGVDPALLEEPNETTADPAAKDTKNGPSKEEKPVFFKPSEGEGNLEFTTFEDGTPEALLAKLVRRLVQTVRKHASLQRGENLTVDTRTLYNALGGFMGVQSQLEQYNQTFAVVDDDSGEDVRPMRKPFLELARSLGLSPDGPTKIPGLDDLVNHLKATFKNELDTIQANVGVGMYDFDSLAQIYRPGTKVVAKNAVAGGVDMIARVEWNRYEQGRTLFGVSKYFKVCLVFCVAVGEHFTLAEVVEGMESFDGKRRLKDLQFVPMGAYSDEEIGGMMASFRTRGEVYNKVATGANYLAYTKGSFFAKSTAKNSAAALATNGRVMVDTQGAYDFGHSIGVGYDPMIMAIKYKYKEYMLHMRAAKNENKKASHDDDGMMLFDSVPKEYLEMTWPAVIGFSLTSKAWGDVLVDGLGEIDFQEKAFESLVLPAARKRMVRALVRHSSDSFNDVISGKGEGSVFLLYGPPGCGKTLTAEAISEMLHRPLYSVSLGQLGTTPADLESKLGEILELCGKWDALILLDEADIFLEKRSSTGSLERNAMVSVMLRLVEYFKGVLFLTSNRVDSLDPAFKTRITLALRYDQLDPAARSQVWKNLLTASGHDLAAFDTDKLAEHVLNGREIKNAIRLAMALAADEEAPLSQDFILETVDILNDFNEKMNSADAY